MIRSSFEFVRPKELEANAPPEARGGARDAVRLLVSNASGSEHRNFGELPELMAPGDLLVVNESATLAASLPARGPAGEFLLNVCTRYGDRIWLAEPRWGVGRPGPIPLTPATPIEAGGVRLAPIGPYPDISRLWFFRAGGDLERAMREVGRPIRYGYVPESYPLETYQTVFSRVPGSAEMPSAGRPFTHRLVEALEKRGVGIAPLVLHTGVSSLESEPDGLEIPPVYPEPFDVPSATAERINATRLAGHRVVAVGTTVVRALETAWNGCRVVPLRGFTRLTLGPGHSVHSVDGLITGLHDPRTSHLALLFAFAGEQRVRAAYADAVREQYLWHEFGDSHLVWASAAQ
ncbi:MAG: S-adenosylmethionine:tRNA ribosyltransferase-isomerase [Thermoplasmata archaeon]